MARLRLLVVVLLAAIGVGALQAAPSFPALTGRVVDQAGVIDPAVEARLDAKLADLEQKTRTQLVVVTLRSLQGYDIADYGYQLGRAWGIGQKGTERWRAADRRAGGAQGAHRGRLWTRGHPDRRGVAPDHRQRHSSALPDRRLLRRHRARRRRPRAASLRRRRGFQAPRGRAERPSGREAKDWARLRSFSSSSASGSCSFYGGEVAAAAVAAAARAQAIRLARGAIPAGGGWSSGGRSSGWPSGGGGFGGGFSGGGGSFGGGGASGSW